MIKKSLGMYCLEHSLFVIKCSFACHPAKLVPCIHPCFPCSCGRNWSTHVLHPLCWAQQMLCAEVQQMDVLSSEDTCFSYGPFYSLCLFSLYFNRYTNKEIIRAVQLFASKRRKMSRKINNGKEERTMPWFQWDHEILRPADVYPLSIVTQIKNGRYYF